MLNVAHFYQLTVAAMALQLYSNLLPLITKFNRSVKCRSTGLTRPSVQTLGAARDEPSHSSLFLLAADRPAGDANFFFSYSLLRFSLYYGDRALRDETCEFAAVKTSGARSAATSFRCPKFTQQKNPVREGKGMREERKAARVSYSRWTSTKQRTP